jgi:menaquinone-dependent protoporphyrinogen oxidase
MRVLVTAASKHGATAEIAQAIGDQLIKSDIDAVVMPIGDVGAIEEYDAVVLGSAVYAGQWLPPAKDFVRAHAGEMATRPVWLFSSGPIGDPPKPEDDPVDAAAMVSATAAREHVIFAGRLDKAKLGFAEKAITMALRAPYGDYRQWDLIRSWASGIALTLQTS